MLKNFEKHMSAMNSAAAYLTQEIKQKQDIFAKYTRDIPEEQRNAPQQQLANRMFADLMPSLGAPMPNPREMTREIEQLKYALVCHNRRIEILRNIHAGNPISIKDHEFLLLQDQLKSDEEIANYSNFTDQAHVASPA